MISPACTKGIRSFSQKNTILVADDNSVINHAIVRIKDNGMSIPKYIQNKIFDQFFTTRPVHKGTGLEPSVARSIVTEAHGVKLAFQTESNVGT